MSGYAGRVFLPLFLLLLLSMTVNAQYVGSAKSDKYHDPSCKHAKRIADENRVEFKTAEEATEAGYVPCKVCKPGAPAKESAEVKSQDAPAEASGRCQATTKKGTQCKRSAQPGSRYCWQHGK